ncbi:MAG: pyruvate formate lyase family protein [Candidatus Alcyoniella australis]|nr:pyruvate formate lyase family protein [Candidatus Alcyoniella australis]
MSVAADRTYQIKQPKGLSARIQWLRDYYFQGTQRPWNNEFTPFGTGTPWDVQHNEMAYFIVPENYLLLQTFVSSFRQAARPIDLPAKFWDWSQPERRAWFVKQVMVEHLPHELLPGDLIAGARFNLQTSLCLDRKQAKKHWELIAGKNGARRAVKWFHDHGYGNAGATPGHIVPGHERVLQIGWKGVHADLVAKYDALGKREKKGPKGAQLRAMITAAQMPRDLAAKYADLCRDLALAEADLDRRSELEQMDHILRKVPWEPAETFWEALQALWLTHMLIMSDENYPGPGISFGRIDQYLLPYWQHSIEQGVDREFLKEMLKCFWMHCNTAYDAIIRAGYQGITAGFGQLITLSGMGPAGRDMTNDLTYAMLEVIDELSPILEPKPNVRLHCNSPDELLDKLIEMISTSQGAPFLLNFDERSMAGMLREAKRANLQRLINLDNVHDYAPVGCLENTMVGNDRSGTVDINLNLLKAVELALNNGRDLHQVRDVITGKVDPIGQDGPATGDAAKFETFEQFWQAYAEQTRQIIARSAELYEKSESIRAQYCPTSYLSCMVKGCAEQGLDVTQGGAEIALVTLEAVTYATTVDSLLAIKYLVFDEGACTMPELIQALRDNWEGHEVLQARAKNKAPKYGRDDDESDAMATRVMELWTDETWNYKTQSTGRQFRPGMLSWNYWVGDGFVLAASPDGRPQGQFLSNAICPSNGSDTNGPTANTNSVGKVFGGKSDCGEGDWNDYRSALPNGASHTITFNPSILRDPEHQQKFKAFLRGYAVNGGSALQINMLDKQMLLDAQRRPQDYRHLLVRVTGYNAYFTSIGRELQNEVIARLSHSDF